MTIWTAIGAVTAALLLISGAIWTVVSLRSDITANAWHSRILRTIRNRLRAELPTTYVALRNQSSGALMTCWGVGENRDNQFHLASDPRVTVQGLV